MTTTTDADQTPRSSHRSSADGVGLGPPVANGALARILAVSTVPATGPAPGTGGHEEREVVAALLGRDPGGAFTVVVRRDDGTPMVIANEPFLRDGTPMPTRYWLVDPDLRASVGRLEAGGGVRQAEAEVDAAALDDCHRRYAAERDASGARGMEGPAAGWGSGRNPPGGQMPPRPSGLVAGRR